MRWALVRKLAISFAVIFGVVVAFRQGLIPPKVSPLPAIVVERPFPLVIDWQLVELQKDRDLCRGLVSSSLVRASQIPDRPLQEGCGWTNAVSVVRLSNVYFPMRAVNCGVAGALAVWMHNVVQRQAQRIFEQDVVAIRQMGVYSCRNIIGSRFWKNRRSEHASANAVDIGGFKLRDGTFVSVKDDWGQPGAKGRFLRAVHSGACRYFRVVLGPDFNHAHHNHFHFDRGPLWRCK